MLESWNIFIDWRFNNEIHPQLGRLDLESLMPKVDNSNSLSTDLWLLQKFKDDYRIYLNRRRGFSLGLYEIFYSLKKSFFTNSPRLIKPFFAILKNSIEREPFIRKVIFGCIR